MLYYKFKNYEEFKDMFGIIKHGNGVCSRKNRILLAYIRNKRLLHEAIETNNYTLLHISSMAELKKTITRTIIISGHSDMSLRYVLELDGDFFYSRNFETDELKGLCKDGDTRSIRYINHENGGKVFKMKAGKLYRSLILDTANVMWGLMSPIGKSALQEFSAISVTTFRMVGAAAAFWILSIFCKQEHVDHRDMLKIFFASLFALVFNQGVFIFGLSMTSPIDASIVTTTLPIVTMVVAAIYLKEPITNKKVLGIFVGAMGALILIISSQAASSGNGSLIGDLLCLVAQISFSIYLTVFKGLSQRYSTVTINKWMFIYASICYIPFSYYDISTIQWAAIPTIAIVQVLYVVLGGSFLAYLCIMTAQRLLRPTVVSMYNYMQPIVASIAAIIMGIGSFGWEKGIAITLVFLGVYIVTQSKSKADFEKAGKEL